MASKFTNAIKDIRSGISLKLLGWAMDVAPEGAERSSLVLLVSMHLKVIVSSDPRRSDLNKELYGGKP